ncbi:hypothetical protein B0J11DRAFT_508052 [Dendryphion nanum]|uniref:Uncharacterized protein n=1 Tax=Dendryphion nanum TaxID=256645 RepID=A0A9P9DKR4_9PLEO|nr:hypothetical protein B0J11DRAFT_508052 [Dendryphion nanum]
MALFVMKKEVPRRVASMTSVEVWRAARGEELASQVIIGTTMHQFIDIDLKPDHERLSRLKTNLKVSNQGNWVLRRSPTSSTPRAKTNEQSAVWMTAIARPVMHNRNVKDAPEDLTFETLQSYIVGRLARDLVDIPSDAKWRTKLWQEQVGIPELQPIHSEDGDNPDNVPILEYQDPRVTRHLLRRHAEDAQMRADKHGRLADGYKFI